MTAVKTLKIDGRTSARARTQTILDVARENGIDIPTLCHLDGLCDVGACRLCLVEVKGIAEAAARLRRPRSQEGMEVDHALRSAWTSYRRMIAGAAVRRAQPHLLGVRLQRPLRAAEPGGAPGHGPHPAALSLSRSCRWTPAHERFGIDHNRCILCTRCVRVCDEIEGAHTWDVMGRGIESARHHRPGPAVGRVGHLHQLRQVRARLPDRRAVREGQVGRRDGQAPPASCTYADEPMHDGSLPNDAKQSDSPPSGWTAAPAATCRSSTWTSG